MTAPKDGAEKRLEGAANDHARTKGKMPSAKAADAYESFLAGAAHESARALGLVEALEWAERGIADYERILKYGGPTNCLSGIREALRRWREGK